MFCPAELRRVAIRCRHAASEAVDPAAANELVFLAQEYEARAEEVEMAELAFEAAPKISLPN
jgi:hypothetical protein